MRIYGKLPIVAALICLGQTVFAQVGTFPVEERFLTVGYDSFQIVRESEVGVELVYTAPDTFERLREYKGVMVDQPEVWLAEDSPYGGVKPDNAKVLADAIREGIAIKLIEAGRNVVDEPGPNVLYLRIALTDLDLTKKKRRPFMTLR